MSAAGQILYLKIEQNCIVYKRSVTLQDIASVECTDVGILRQVLQEQIYYFSGNEKSSLVQVFSVLDVIRKIHEKYPVLEVENIGEPDFVIRYVPDPEKKSVQYLKTALVCVILFFGSAFTIMTFIEDVSVNKVFDALYTTEREYWKSVFVSAWPSVSWFSTITLERRRSQMIRHQSRWQCANTSRMWIPLISRPAAGKGKVRKCECIPE